jgi:hypothetical protein
MIVSMSLGAPKFRLSIQAVLTPIICLIAVHTLAAQPLSETLRQRVREEIDDGAILGNKPALRVSGDMLIVEMGDINVAGLGEGNMLQFGPIQHMLQLEALRRYAFAAPIDQAAAARFLEAIDKEIADEVQLIQSPGETIDTLRPTLALHDRKIADLLFETFDAVARARGLIRVRVKRAAHPGWTVTVTAPPDSTVRYTPLLNFLLNCNTPEKIAWSTAQNGDKLKLKGRYRVELLKGAVVVDSRQPSISAEYSLRFR